MTRQWCFVALFSVFVGIYGSAAESDFYRAAEKNGKSAQKSFQACYRFMHGWMGHRDVKTGLIPRNLTKSWFWNAQDSAADNYPFMVLTSAMLEHDLFHGTMREMLETEQRLTNRLDNLPDDYDFAKQGFRTEQYDLSHLIFGGSEYVKDGLIPLTEWLGKSPWSERMIGIMDSIWDHAEIETPFGKIPSESHEVNGEQLQVLCRLYWMTQKEAYREYAFRLADYYFQEHLPTESDRLQLDDHGCEVVGGLAGAYYLAAHTDPERKQRYQPAIHHMIDRILEVGMNEDGYVYELVDPKPGEVLRDELSDNWGYNYTAILNVAQIDGVDRYLDAVKKVLERSMKYKDYPWEGGGSDGYSDAIEGGLNLLNRVSVPTGFEWVDYSTDVLLKKQRYDGVIEGWHGDGNFGRTLLMVALWKTKGLTVTPWRQDISFGAEEKDGTLYVSIDSDWDWRGTVQFDIPRHKEYLHLPSDYPRINQFPEWFTVEADRNYTVAIEGGESFTKTGLELHQGMKVTVSRDTPFHFVVKPK